MPETPYRCPHCRAAFPTAERLDAHLQSHPQCRAYASLARSLASIGVRLCPRCRLAMTPAAYIQWSTDGFVHRDCLSDAEQRGEVAAPTAAGPDCSPTLR